MKTRDNKTEKESKPNIVYQTLNAKSITCMQGTSPIMPFSLPHPVVSPNIRFTQVGGQKNKKRRGTAQNRAVQTGPPLNPSKF
jgi:hypothetical protein